MVENRTFPQSFFHKEERHMRGFTDCITLVIVFALTVLMSPAVQAQTFNVLYNFTGAWDGAHPNAGVTMDARGNLYGTAIFGGDLSCNAPHGCGTVYELEHRGSGFVLKRLHSFGVGGGADGGMPTAPVVFGPNGALYSTTIYGGAYARGVVFKLRPLPRLRVCKLCSWPEKVLYDFKGGANGDGSHPIGLIFNQAGDTYGATSGGGTYGHGTVYELSSSGGTWTDDVLHIFGSGSDGSTPYRSVLVFDNAGNLYGTTSLGGSSNYGTVFQLTPSGGGWTENVIYNFLGGNDGGYPYSGLIIDQSGNLYGTTTDLGTGGGGTVFELSPSGGGWTYSVLHSIPGPAGYSCGPAWALVMDAAGSLYDTTQCDGANTLGSVFKLTNTGGSWTYTSLHDFTGNSNDGEYPASGVTLDASGNLYGTTNYGGTKGQGTVWEIMP
jgi:uncharacterized repeat protein (TIGR03803 family)